MTTKNQQIKTSTRIYKLGKNNQITSLELKRSKTELKSIDEKRFNSMFHMAEEKNQ